MSIRVLQSSGLGGLGWAQTAWCDKYDQALDLLQNIVTRADKEGSTGPNLETARRRYEAETSWTGRTPVSGAWNCDSRTAELGVLLEEANKELKTPFAMPPSITGAIAGETPAPMSPVVKFAIIGGISVVGIIGLAYITGQVAPLLRVFKK